MNTSEMALHRFKKLLKSAHLMTPLIVLLLALGVYNQFIQDDAFISFRYAENLVSGNGLTWNIADKVPVEGYTNFLWTLLIALGIYINLDPITWSMLLGILFGGGTLFFIYKLTYNLTKSHSAALIAVLLVGTNYSFSSYLTGGLETQLQTFLIIFMVYITFIIMRIDGARAWHYYLTLSILFSLAVMTRIDSVLVCGILFLFNTYKLVYSEVNNKIKYLNFSYLLIPGLLLTVSWLFFKLQYYGDILPNTYYIKATGQLPTFRGVYYIASFFVNYGLIFFILLAILNFKKFSSKSFYLVISSIVIVWLSYVFKVSGDFMEYRFIIPVIPLIYVIVTTAIYLLPNWKLKLSSILFLVLISLYHANTFEGSRGIESIKQLNAHIYEEDQDWKSIGVILGEHFYQDQNPVVISTTAAGAIPFYSKLPTIDMLGLNDKWIAKNGVLIDSRPGHSRFAPISYLLESNVNLIIGHPNVKPLSAPPTMDLSIYFWGNNHNLSELPKDSKIIELPINSSYRLDMLYVQNHELIDKAIRELNLKSYSIF